MRAALLAIPLLIGVGVMAGAVLPPVDMAMAQGGSTINDEVARAAIMVENGRNEEAIQIFDAILARTPDYGPALANRAIAYAWTNRLDEAARDLDAATRVMPDAAVLHRARAIIADRRSDAATAIAEFSRSLELEPGNRLALQFRAHLFQRAANHAAALADAEAYIAAHPEDPDAYTLKADLLIGQRQPSLAAVEAGQLIRLFPENAYAVAAAARIYDGLADRDRALAAVNQAIAREPDFFYYRLLRARFRRWDDFAGRRADLEAALARDPGNNDAITWLGLVDFKERKWGDVIARFSAILEREPRDFGLLAYRAMARWNAGDRAGAERDYRAALAAASGADDFSLICGSFAREGFALDWAMEACDRAVTLNSNESAYHANRGLVELRLGRLDAALADYNAAIDADRRRADGYYGRALVLHRQGDQRAAEADRRQALEIDPRIAETYQEYGFANF
jgi:tetratricopeptide (TPR) repeat protein